jgi:hypothetical protein
MTQHAGQRTALFKKLSQLYLQMDEAYNHVAASIGLSCATCPDNCCTSYFHHHTYIEWAYVWEGMRSLSHQDQREFVDKAEAYVRRSRMLMVQGLKPNVMCPLNDQGLCQLYEYRLMICRLHGVPNLFLRPDGKEMKFPGCFRCQELCPKLEEAPVVDRTNLYRDLASLEMAFTGVGVKTLPRVSLTLADMLVQGPPTI